MSETDRVEQLARLLEDIRDAQKLQLERQAESLSIQREQFQLFLRQHEQTAQLQARAETVQEKSAQIVGRIQRFVPLALAAVVALLAYVTWLLLRFLR